MDLVDVSSTSDGQVWRMRKFSFDGRILEHILSLPINLSIGSPFSSLALPNRISFFFMILPEQHGDVLNNDANQHSSLCLENLSLLPALKCLNEDRGLAGSHLRRGPYSLGGDKFESF